MQTPDPKKDQSKAAGGQSAAASPLDRYTVAPAKSPDNNEEKESPYYKPQAPSISLPKGGGALKGIDEKFTVNPVNGTSSLEIPLPLTPGRAGFTPALSLQYNSGSGNSEFGLGWALSLPSIQRKTDKKLPQYNDVEESDVFLLAGAEDLVPVLDEEDERVIITEVVSVGAGMTGIDYTFTVKRYRPRIEGLYARIEFITREMTGHSWWKVTTKDNVVTYYGLTPDACICDPGNPNRIFKWFPQMSYDNKGNSMRYFYKSEDAEHLQSHPHELNRLNGLAPFTNTYLKSVAYCNAAPSFPENKYEPTLPNPPGLPETMHAPANYLMQMVLDYGEHDENIPTPFPATDEEDEDITWPCRCDAFSDFHAGFEVRTYRRCSRVLMFHYFTELDEGEAVLARSLNLSYSGNAWYDVFAGYDEAIQISFATVWGYIKDGAGYHKKALPTMSFTYTETIKVAVEGSQVFAPEAVAIENLPQGLTGTYQWIDLWGEGLTGVLTEQANAWYYQRNASYENGIAHFGPPELVAEKPSLQGLGNGLQWQDLDADGRRQVVSRSMGIPGYYELNDDQEWEPFRTFESNVNIDWNSPYTHLLDLNGDGRPDILVTEEAAFRWYENAGTAGVLEGKTVPAYLDEEKGPRLVHSNPTIAIYLADMNGDGMTDIVRIQNGEVCYWPNMGYGKFGAKICMTDSPVFAPSGAFSTQYLTLADTNGTGAADIVYFSHDHCAIYLNLAGNAWLSTAYKIAPFGGATPDGKIAIVDLLGDGTSCLVWSSSLPQHASKPLRYIKLWGSSEVKPYMLRRIENGMGKKTNIFYVSSQFRYTWDRAHGAPWATRLPFPVTCVNSVTVTDSISGNMYATQYSYHHGYYDHEEREFRGFGKVVATDAMYANNMEEIQDRVQTVSWYHTGAWMREGTLLEAFEKEYYNVPGIDMPVYAHMPEGLSATERREAHRALKGSLLRQEVYALLDEGLSAPYAITTNAYCVRQEQPLANNRYAVFYAYKRETLALGCEGNVEDPRMAHEFTLEVDAYGNVTDVVNVAYPRLVTSDDPEIADRQQRMHITLTKTRFTNDEFTDGAYLLRLPQNHTIYEVTGVTTLNPVWLFDEMAGTMPLLAYLRYTETPNNTDPEARLVAQSYTSYIKPTGGELGFGELQVPGMVFQKYTLAIDEDMLTDAAWYDSSVDAGMLSEGGYFYVMGGYCIPSGTVTYDVDHFYTPIAYQDPWLNETIVDYWGDGTTNYYLLPASVTDPLGNVSTVDEYNWYNLQPSIITDVNDNQSHILYDALGLPTATAIMEKDGTSIGDTIAGIDATDEDGLVESFFSDPLTYAADVLQGATWRCVYNLFPHPVDDVPSPVVVAMLAREKHNSDDPDSPILIRLTYTDGLGRVAMHKVQAAPTEAAPTTPRWLGSGKTDYNNKGNVMRQYEPYFSATHAYDYQAQAEAATVSAELYYDALGRLRKTILPDGTFTKTEWDAWSQTIYDNNDTVMHSAWYAERTGAGPLASDTQEAETALLASYHHGTPTLVHVDSLGRPICTRQHNRTDITSPAWGVDLYYHSFVDLDVQGNRLAVHDARGLTPLTYTYNMVQAPATQISMDSGPQRMLLDAAGQPLYSWDANNSMFHFRYDELRRMVYKGVTPSGGTEQKLVVMEYGEGITSAESYNIKGKPSKQYDGAGMKQIVQYDFKGNPIAVEQTLLDDATITDVDWSSPPTLSTEVFTTSYTYDALSRPVTIDDPGYNLTRHAYDAAGALFAVYLTPYGGSETAYVEAIYYNEKGQRKKINYGNSTNTVYNYDEYSFRLKRLLTRKGADVFQDLNYWYDPVGNIIILENDAEDAFYFDGAAVQPHQAYKYDALYRLIKTAGREKIGLAAAGFTSPDNYNDSAWISSVHPGDHTAVQTYIQRYDYDEVGNILELQHIGQTAGDYTRTYTYDAASNQLLTTEVGSNTYSYGYDGRGNIKAMPHLSSIGYNYDNHMSYADLGGGGETWYQYDSGGQRSRKVIINGSLTEERIYLGSYEIYRKFISSSLTLERTTVHISDDTGRIAMLEVRTVGTDPAPAELSRYIYSNHLGTASLELDENAEIISYEEYHPYGTTAYQAMNSSIAAVAKRYRYTGKERDDETGLYYHGARYYIPWLVRWMAVDPLESKFSPESPYNYCHCNPIQLVDADGMQSHNPQHIASPKTGGDTSAGTASKPGSSPENAINLNEGHAKATYPIKALTPTGATPLPTPQASAVAAYRPVQDVLSPQAAPIRAPYHAPPIEVLRTDVYGMPHNGTEADVTTTVNGINSQYYTAVGENIAGGFFGALGYTLGGEEGSFVGANVDNAAAAGTALGIPKKPSAQKYSAGTGFFVSRGGPKPITTIQQNGGRGYVSGFREMLPKAREAAKGNTSAIGEFEAAKYLRNLGDNVHFQTPTGQRSREGQTADFLVGGETGTGIGGVPYEVYTPTSSNVGNVISAIRDKTNQSPNLILNLKHTNITPSSLGNISKRIENSGGIPFNNIIFLMK